MQAATRFEAAHLVFPWIVACAGVASAVAALIVHAEASSLLMDAGDLYLADVWVAVVAPPAGALLLSTGKARALGAALLSAALIGAGTLAGSYATYTLATDSAAGGLASIAAWVATWTWAPYLVLLLIVPLLVPDGRLASPKWRRAAVTIAGAIAFIAVACAVAPGNVEAFPLLRNPVGIEQLSWLGPVVDGAIAALVVVGLPLVLVSIALRWRRADGVERRPLAWIAGAFAAHAVLFLLAGSLPYPWIDIAPAAGFTLLIGTLVGAVFSIERARAQAERAHFRHELHDAIGPEMAGLALQLHVIAEGEADPALRPRLYAAEDALRRTVGQIRRILDDPRAEADSHGPLVLVLGERARAFSEVAATKFSVRDEGCIEPLPSPVRAAAYGIATEAMTNALRHAFATACVVRLAVRDGWLMVDVEDDGRGTGQLAAPGIGTESMTARAQQLGGRLDIGAGQNGRGSRVTAHLPLHAN